MLLITNKTPFIRLKKKKSNEKWTIFSTRFEVLARKVRQQTETIFSQPKQKYCYEGVHLLHSKDIIAGEQLNRQIRVIRNEIKRYKYLKLRMKKCDI